MAITVAFPIFSHPSTRLCLSVLVLFTISLYSKVLSGRAIQVSNTSACFMLRIFIRFGQTLFPFLPCQTPKDDRTSILNTKQLISAHPSPKKKCLQYRIFDIHHSGKAILLFSCRYFRTFVAFAMLPSTTWWWWLAFSASKSQGMQVRFVCCWDCMLYVVTLQMSKESSVLVRLTHTNTCSKK